MTVPISTRPEWPKSASGSRLNMRLPSTGLLLYIPVQWIGGSSAARVHYRSRPDLRASLIDGTWLIRDMTEFKILLLPDHQSLTLRH